MIQEYQNFLTTEEVARVLEILESKKLDGTHIFFDREMSSELQTIAAPKLPEFAFTDHISTGNTKESIKRHRDPKLDSKVTHKLLVYLVVPEKGGGTFFDRPKLPPLYIEPEVGKAVIFDIDTVHWGAPFSGGIKRVFGLRMYFK